MKDYKYLAPFAAVVLGLLLVLGSGPGTAVGQFQTNVYREADRLTVADGGTLRVQDGGIVAVHGEQLRTARVQVNAATSVGAVSVSGVLPGDLGIATSNTSGATVAHVISSTDTVTVHLGDVAAATLTVPVLIFSEFSQ